MVFQAKLKLVNCRKQGLELLSFVLIIRTDRVFEIWQSQWMLLKRWAYKKGEVWLWESHSYYQKGSIAISS